MYNLEWKISINAFGKYDKQLLVEKCHKILGGKIYPQILLILLLIFKTPNLIFIMQLNEPVW